MAIKSFEELKNGLQSIIGENTSDEAIAFIEDFNDTINAQNSGEDWETRYKENDEAWRKKYRDRFFNTSEKVNEKETNEDNKPLTYDDLFITKKE